MPDVASPITVPQPGEYAEFYAKYIAKVSTEGDVITTLREQSRELIAFLRGVSDADANLLHPPYTWTIKQVVNHITDGERIFAYRMLRIARGDKTPLPGFDENEYARAANVDAIKLVDLINEFESVRAATLSLIANLPQEAWPCTGVANNNPVSVRALAWIMAGHVQHHLDIMRKRLGI